VKLAAIFALLAFCVPSRAATVNPASSVTADTDSTPWTIPYRDQSGDIFASTFHGSGAGLTGVVTNPYANAMVFQNSNFDIGGSTLVTRLGVLGIGINPTTFAGQTAMVVNGVVPIGGVQDAMAILAGRELGSDDTTRDFCALGAARSHLADLPICAIQVENSATNNGLDYGAGANSGWAGTETLALVIDGRDHSMDAGGTSTFNTPVWIYSSAAPALNVGTSPVQWYYCSGSTSGLHDGALMRGNGNAANLCPGGTAVATKISSE